MNSYSLDSGNNIQLGTDNRINRVDKGAEVVQSVRSRLLFYLAESPLDTSKGVPYFEKIFTKPANLPETESILKTEIIRTDGVQELLDFGLEFDSKTRNLTIEWRAISIYGDVIGATVNV